MHPILFKITDNLVLYSYGLMVAIGLIAAVVLFRILCDKAGIDDKAYNFYLMDAVVSIVIGFLAAALYQSVYYLIQTGEWSFGALTFMGGLIGGVACFILGAVFVAKPSVQRQFWRIANLIAPSILIAHAFGRIGCFFCFCCYGKKTDSWIGVQFPDMSYKVIPTQLIESAFLFILCAVLVVLLLKFKKENLLMLVYLYGYAVFRFILEFWRGDDRGGFFLGLSPSQWQSIVMLLVAVALTLYIYLFKRTPFAKGFAWKWTREKATSQTEISIDAPTENAVDAPEQATEVESDADHLQ